MKRNHRPGLAWYASPLVVRSLLLAFGGAASLPGCGREPYGSSGWGRSGWDDSGISHEAGVPAFNPPDRGGDSSIGFFGPQEEGGGSDVSSTTAIPTACVVGRSCDTGCDELLVGGLHTYIESMPDDGSAPPTMAAIQPFNAVAPIPASPGPCIVEPADGALFPNNWVRARFRYKSGIADPVFQIRIHAARQANDLVVYTRSKTWKIPKSVWTALSASTWGEDITTTVSALDPVTGRISSSKVTFQIAPAQSNGAMVYWAAIGQNAGQAWLESFQPGDESVAQALTVSQVKWNLARGGGGALQTAGAPAQLPAGAPACIGCHVTAPDRKTVLFMETWPWDGVAAMVDPGETGNLPPWLTPGGAEALSMPFLGMMSFSAGDWSPTSHIAVAATQLPDGALWDNANHAQDPGRLAWIDLSSAQPPVLGTMPKPALTAADLTAMQANRGKSYGIIARDGDQNGALSPAWSHDGKTIVYVSTNAAGDGRLGCVGAGGGCTPATIADLFSVPYNGRAGGAATPIQGASDPNVLEYYPSLSPDDKYVAFDRADRADNPYYDARAEVYVVPAAGGTATRLKSNDPPSCTGATSPGVTNSWPRFAPDGPSCGGKTYYWIIFSSSREGTPFANLPGGGSAGGNTSQLYLTALVDSGGGIVTSYPATYIWNQHSNAAGAGFPPAYVNVAQSNHTPQWETVTLPAAPPASPPPHPQPPR
jgi:hypothetical protein